jgi:parallel beta-helix repeat protein
MKTCLIVILSFVVTFGKAETYYFSANSGDDSRKEKEAQNPLTPWKTLSKLNSFYSKLRDGDVILFKRGEVFYGSIIISEKDKKKTAAITFDAYGTGAKPIITSLQTISGWKSLGEGIYEKQSTAFPDALNMVLFNGNLQPIGRWPKVNEARNGYLTFQSHRDTTAITSNQIANAKSFLGGEVVIRKNLWILDRGRVTGQTASTVNYASFASPAHPTTYVPTDGFGFFFQNHVNTLTAAGDWCYEAATKKIKMCFGDVDPNSQTVKVPAVDNLVEITYGNKIIFDNIAFVGANENAFKITYSTNIQLDNCDISFSGINGIHVINAYYDLPEGVDKKFKEKYAVPAGLSHDFKITNCTITNTNNNAINGGNANYWTIQNNRIDNTGMIRGMGLSGDGQYEAIQYVNSNSLVEYNTITNTGYIGINFIGDNTIIKNNYIDRFCMVKSDGGGIYTHGETGANRKVIGNIVGNGIGDVRGTSASQDNPYSGQVHGIYMDGNTSNVSIENNTSFNNAHSGLFLGSATNINVTNNLLYNNTVAQLKAIDNGGLLTNIKINNNTLVARDSAQLIVSFVLTGHYFEGSYNIGSVDNNYYCRPLYEPQGIVTQGQPNYPTYYNYPGGGIAEGYTNQFYSLDTWQKLKGWDEHTQKSPKNIDNLDKLRFEFNATKNPRTVNLDGTYIDVKNQVYSGTVTLAPFSSIILIKTSEQTAQRVSSTNNKIEITNNVTTTISAYPNPFNNTMSIEVTPSESGTASLILLNQEGRNVKRLFVGQMEEGERRKFFLNSDGLQSGIYMLQFNSKTKTIIKKISFQ